MAQKKTNATNRQTNLPNESNKYLSKREELRLAEIELMRQRERVAELRRGLPQGAAIQDYAFDEGPANLLQCLIMETVLPVADVHTRIDDRPHGSRDLDALGFETCATPRHEAPELFHLHDTVDKEKRITVGEILLDLLNMHHGCRNLFQSMVAECAKPRRVQAKYVLRILKGTQYPQRHLIYELPHPSAFPDYDVFIINPLRGKYRADAAPRCQHRRGDRGARRADQRVDLGHRVRGRPALPRARHAARAA
jgi:hypothetical protein